MSETKIKQCSCKNVYQDDKYGKGKRVMNRCANEKDGKWRCTACGRKSSE